MTDIALPRRHRQTLISRQEVLKVVDGQHQSELAPSRTIAVAHAGIPFLLSYKEGQHRAQTTSP